MKTMMSLTTLALSAVLASTALADESAPKTTELTLDRYDKPMLVERERNDLKRSAVFSADPQSIDDSAILVFEVRSVSTENETLRWRCVAEKNVSECLGARVSIPYLKNDVKVVLSVVAKPKNSPEAIALLEGNKTLAKN